jgi:NADH-ubiquinone oxidoreductase chain 3
MSSIIFFLLLVPLIGLLLISLNSLLAMHKSYKEKSSPFECGFHSFLGQNRQQFSVSFFLFGLLFLIFDLEIVLLYPFTVSGNHNSSYGLTIVFTFILILTVGFCFEIGRKALNIYSRQSNNSITGSGSVLKAKYQIIKHIYHNSFLTGNINNRKFSVKSFYDGVQQLTPPKPHSFQSLSQQTNLIMLKKIFKYLVGLALNLITKLRRFFTFNNIIKFIILGVITFYIRYLIFKYFNVDVFKDFSEPITWIYYPLISLFSGFIKYIFPVFHCMDNDSSSSSSSDDITDPTYLGGLPLVEDGEKLNKPRRSLTPQEKLVHWEQERNGFVSIANGFEGELDLLSICLRCITRNAANLSQEQIDARQHVSFEFGNDKVHNREFLTKKINEQKGIYNKSVFKAMVCQRHVMDIHNDHPNTILSQLNWQAPGFKTRTY